MAAGHAVIPAGGRGLRIGGGKPARMLAGRPLIEFPVAAAIGAGLAALVVAREETELPLSLLERGAQLAIDSPGPQHPLTGVITGLAHAQGAVVVIAGDMPLVPSELIAWLADQEGSLALADDDGELQPLLARYEFELLEPLTAAAADGRSAKRALRECGVRIAPAGEYRQFGAPEEILFDVDTEDDLARAEQLLAKSA
jgi:molybdopterin-guanine dinucleotide biosynthesis protein A